MWWFIEELERMEGPDTAFAGAWGRFKPGYHCDAWELWNHTDKNGNHIWRNDYSLFLPDDKVLGTALEQFGAAVDWTFLSAQAGNFTNFRKYGSRIRAAWVAHDPRLRGWREVLCQGDGDNPADGYDFVSWTERTPDDTHRWHMHFSCLRKFLSTLRVYRAMISILKGETLAQWLAQDQVGGGRMLVPFTITDGTQAAGAYDDFLKVHQMAANGAEFERWRQGQAVMEISRAQYDAGKVGSNWDGLMTKWNSGTGGGGESGGVTMADVHDAIANSSIRPPDVA